ncbi:restriction endonuclease subunit S [Escherichia coli]|uniref:restriction endonuclease subunit S n=1 Tax=Escherichia coli TaxID=562 RepID=UPI000BEAE443|nr:restriction endonuclease subunit S [Escherichia coli]ECI3200221.1 restriction endonuclease subunit S [Salmonella enterica subsp. enterica serovar Mbandaka]EKE0072115.1 restriction endonuclease subunit S [Escherichia coli]HAX2012852.1 restriction endonuclease subunit S [Escherichia coli]HBN7265785.1 restriction endonuclease subunit S [Escherichia coli]HBQ4211357.1 restriction endonuclease subunit S [Escherichia coli]
MVPKGWSSVQAQDVCKSISVGVVIKPTQYYVPEGYGVKAFRSANVREGFINDSDWVYFSHEGHAINKKSHLKTGDVLIVRTGYPGTACVVTPEFEGSNAIDIVIARPDMDKIIPEYLCAYTNSHIGKSQVLDLQGGMAQKHLNVGAYQVLKINLPPLREQKKIAQILLTWDNAISVTENLLANSQQQKKALMQQLLTGKKRLLDENGVRFSGEWEKGKFCDMANIDTGYAFKSKDFTQSDSGIPIIRMSDFKTGGLDVLGAAKVDRDSVNGLDKFKLRVGDFVFGMSGSLNNYGRVEKKDLPCYLNQRVGRILAKECANQAFITYLYLSDSIQQSILDKAAGAAQLNISISDLRSMVVYYPCIEEQQKIAAVLSAADAEISTLEKKLACLRDEKKALMQQLLTGKRRVKVDEAVAE